MIGYGMLRNTTLRTDNHFIRNPSYKLQRWWW